MRRRLRLRHLPRACRCSMARDGGRAFADGGGHARLRLRRAAGLALVLPDQGDGGARRPSGAYARAASLVISLLVPPLVAKFARACAARACELRNRDTSGRIVLPLHISATSPISGR